MCDWVCIWCIFSLGKYVMCYFVMLLVYVDQLDPGAAIPYCFFMEKCNAVVNEKSLLFSIFLQSKYKENTAYTWNSWKSQEGVQYILTTSTLLLTPS